MFTDSTRKETVFQSDAPSGAVRPSLGFLKLGQGEEANMPKDNREALKVLQLELDFIEKGGYGRSVRTPWLPTRPFMDSPTCINFNEPHRIHACEDCLLIQFVPPERRSEAVPCHHIPLNSGHETIHILQNWVDQESMEEVIKDWLRSTINKIEKK